MPELNPSSVNSGARLWRWLLPVLGLLVLGGCKLATPFRGPAASAASHAPGETAVVALTHVTLGDDTDKNSVFWDHTGRVIDALPGQPGYLGHSVRRELFGNQAWTMTVWRDESSLRAFVQSEVHQTAIRNGFAAVAGARFANVALSRAEIPVSWTGAERILIERGRGY